MPLFHVHLAHVVLGPWGALLAVGVGIAILSRRRWVAAAVGGATGGVVSRARQTAAYVSDRVQTATAHVEEWSSDLYAEARADWEAGRASGPATSAADADPQPGRVRGANGRFIKGG